MMSTSHGDGCLLTPIISDYPFKYPFKEVSPNIEYKVIKCSQRIIFLIYFLIINFECSLTFATIRLSGLFSSINDINRFPMHCFNSRTCKQRKHRVTIPCKWSFVMRFSYAFHVLLLGFIGVFSLRKPKI